MPCLDETQIQCLTALVDCLIPEDGIGPSGSQCGVVSFAIGQLAGPFGAGDGTCVSGTCDGGVTEDAGAMSPLANFRVGLSDLDALSRLRHGSPFSQLYRMQKEELLKRIESGEAGHRLRLFFELALTTAYEGFFADPIHGGNHDAVSWRMIGFPGCGHDHTAFVGRDEPVSHIIPLRTVADVRR